MLTARSVILAAPAHATARLLSNLDGRLADLCGGVPYVSAGTVVLAYRSGAVTHPLEGTGFVVPPGDSGCRITAATWVSSKWPDRAPPGHALLRAYVGGALDQDVLAREDRDIATLAHVNLASIIGLTERPDWSRVFRWDHANPQYEVGHLDRIAAIDRRLGEIPGLFVTGSGFRGTGIPDCVADARAVASRAASTLGEDLP
jgi:oxygen-dependent protoporphyrinogen oxidase